MHVGTKFFYLFYFFIIDSFASSLLRGQWQSTPLFHAYIWEKKNLFISKINLLIWSFVFRTSLTDD